MARPTIAQLAKTAAVSVSTVDRVINGRNPVRRDTAERVLAAAEQIGFYAAVAVVAAQHPKIAQAIDTLDSRGVPVFALISEISARCGVGYAGLDNWKVGRTSAWMFTHLCKKPGKIAILVGSHRYRCQELNE